MTKTSFDQEYSQLNAQQLQAVEHIDGPMMVLAGAGTGKTQIIALRIANILQQTQADPQNILCLTFTETGAAAMRKRLMNIIGPAAYHVTIGTFHSFCNDIIQQYPEYFLIAQDLAPLDDVEQVKVFKEVIDALPVDSTLKPFAAPYFYIRAMSSAVQTLKRENIDVAMYQKLVQQSEACVEQFQDSFETFISMHGRTVTEQHVQDFIAALNNCEVDAIVNDIAQLHVQYEQPSKFKQAIKRYYERWKNQLPKQRELAFVYEHYQQQLHERGRYDYEDMLLFVVSAFEEHEELLAKYQEQYQYILVDEYQDTNGAQNKVVELLGSFFEDPNIFVVGDDRQSIYRFQGASLENILDFTQRYGSKAQLVSLQTNYRSHQVLLNAASAMIAHNQRSLSQQFPELATDLTSHASEDEAPVFVHEFSTSQSEYYWVAKKIQALIDQGIAHSEIAILYRNNRDVDDVMDILEYLTIPFHLQAGIDILQDHQINKLITLLRYVAGMEHPDVLYYILQYDFLALDRVDVMKVTLHARKHRKHAFEVIHDLETLQTIGCVFPDALVDFSNKLLEWRAQAVNQPITRFFETFVNETGFLEHVMNLPERIEHLNRMNTLFDEMKQLNRSSTNMQIKEFISYLDLLQEHSLTVQEHELFTNRDAVRLMTAHQAKGLEFEHVFMIRCIDKHWGNVVNRNLLSLPPGIIRNDISYDVKEKNEDERRLFYVAMTRAKQRLYITYPQRQMSGREVVPALFISEIPDEYIEHNTVGDAEDEALARLQTALLEAPAFDAGQREREYLRDLVADYPLSASSLNAYLECPRNFLYGRLLRVIEPKGRSVSFGTAVHNTLRDVARSLSAKKKVSDASIKKMFTDYLQQQIMTPHDQKETLAFGETVITQYVSAHKKRLAKVLEPERNFSSEGVHIDGIPIVGSIDAMEVVDETAKTIHVIDYKTGNPDNKSDKLANKGEYHRQLMFYKLLCDNSPRFPYTAESGEINFVQMSKKKNEYTTKQFEFTEADMAEFTALVTQVYSDIQALKFLDAPEDAMCGECDYCKLYSA